MGDLLDALGARGVGVVLQRLGDNPARGQARVERGIRILEHDLHPFAPRTQLLAAKPRNVVAVEAHAALGRLDQSQDEATNSRFSAARFANQAQRLTRLERKADPVDGLDFGMGTPEQPTPHGKVLLEAVGFDDEPADARWKTLAGR